MATGRDVLAVAVLYRSTAEQSESVVSMRRLLRENQDLFRRADLMLCDNSPYEQATPTGFDGVYLRDRTNAGLAWCYGEALRLAEESGARWLMLLDQDTTVTEEYLREVLDGAERLAGEAEVVAMVPKLVEDGVICSPAYPPLYGPARPVDAKSSGVAKTRLHAFNSGAVLRVSAVRAMGGFSRDFPLDYLDHATFTALQARGGTLFVLRSELRHELSSNDETRTDAAFAERQTGVLDAEYRFYRRYGSTGERFLRSFRLFRAIAGRVFRRKDAAQSRRMLRSAMRW